jgi:hypothetical protein
MADSIDVSWARPAPSASHRQATPAVSGSDPSGLRGGTHHGINAGPEASARGRISVGLLLDVSIG